ncbi:MAG: Protein-disulfide isomerase [Parcubacteria group bacterium Gr01-1014_31]|nr:MAG: Protein-disulfide isomerase [Parcubacteria group bacterium Gr01-1014_31]
MEPLPPQMTKRERWELKQRERAAQRQGQTRQQTTRRFLPWTVAIIAVAVLIGWWLRSGSTGGGIGTSDLQPDDWVRGNPDAAVTLMEYADFQCPACAAYAPLVKQLGDEYGDRVKIVMRHFPLRQHGNAVPASQAAEAAGRQGKFWEMHDLLYERQDAWKDSRTPLELFGTYAAELQLDAAKFQADYADPAVRAKIDAHQQSGTALQISGTPSFFVNGRAIDYPRSLEEFKQYLDAALANAPVTATSTTALVHQHANLAIVLNGKPVDLSADKYQSTKEKELDTAVHLHDEEGMVVHTHRAGVTLNDFLKSLSMDLTPDCFTLDARNRLCNADGKTVKLFVDGRANDQYGDYVIADLNRILISYGAEGKPALQRQLDAVPDTACIYSKTCPERGEPPTEECVGGLGTGCE